MKYLRIESYDRGIIAYSDDGINHYSLCLYDNLNKCSELKNKVESFVELCKNNSNCVSGCISKLESYRFAGFNLIDLFQRFDIYPDAYICKMNGLDLYYPSQKRMRQFHWMYCINGYEIMTPKEARQQLMQLLFKS